MRIRSQDRRDNVVINVNKDSVYINYQNQICLNGNVLGIYSTKEKAIKALDQLQKYIDNYCAAQFVYMHTDMTKSTHSAVNYLAELNTFEMPQDKDV